MARQPIYDRQLNRIAYELLYRGSSDSGCPEMDSASELSALSSILLEVGLDRLVGRDVAFVNVPSSLLGTELLYLLPSERVVLEILEDTPWNREVERHVQDLKEAGYTLALDDYRFEPAHEPFLDYVDIVKVEILGFEPEELRFYLERARRRRQTFLAEKVEFHETAQLCHDAGFDLFQGYFYSKPNMIGGYAVPSNYAACMALLSRLQNPDIDLVELGRLVSGDVLLCHRILRLVNSVALCMSSKIESIPHALLVIGVDRVRKLAALVLATSMATQNQALGELAMVRARYCEAVARLKGFAEPEKHFMMGLLSILDAMTNLPIEKALEGLPLAKDVEEALLQVDDSSNCARTLQHMLAIERGDWEAAEKQLPGVPSETYTEAISWAVDEHRFLVAETTCPRAA